MPGLAVKSPPDTLPLRISLPETLRTLNKGCLPRLLPDPSLHQLDQPKSLDSPNLNDPSLNNPDLGLFLLKLDRGTIASGDGHIKALDYATCAAKSFERCAIQGEPSLDLVMSLLVLAAIYCCLGRFEEAVSVLELCRSVSRGLKRETRVL